MCARFKLTKSSRNVGSMVCANNGIGQSHLEGGNVFSRSGCRGLIALSIGLTVCLSVCLWCLPVPEHHPDTNYESGTESHRTKSHRTKCLRTKSHRTESHRTKSHRTKCLRTKSHRTKSHNMNSGQYPTILNLEKNKLNKILHKNVNIIVLNL